MLNSELLAIMYGLASAATWGTGDFSGGFATKTSNVSGVLLIGYITGVILLSIVALWVGSPVPDMYSVMTGAASGIGGVLGLGALYMGLARSRMGIVAPLAGIISAMLPVFFAMFLEGLPSSTQILGFALALADIWFLSAPEKSQKIQLKQFGYPVVAGVCFGLSFILVDQAVEQSVLWPLVAARGMGITLLLILMFVFHKGALPQRNNYPLICLAGIFETAGNTFYALAAHTGRLDIAAVLSSMYPATTVMLAWIILKEHLSCRQWIGVFTALTALALIAA